MLNESEIEKKLFEQPAMFTHYMSRNEYLEAALCVEWASMVALFIQLDEEKKAELFGDKQPDKPVKGMINEDLYIKACDWCVFKGGYAISEHTYQNVQKLL